MSAPVFPRFHDLEQLGRDGGNGYLALENHDYVDSGFLSPAHRVVINCDLEEIIEEMADCTRLALRMCRTRDEIPSIVWQRTSSRLSLLDVNGSARDVRT